jgi:hypothetical protein
MSADENNISQSDIEPWSSTEQATSRLCVVSMKASAITGVF